MVRRLGALSRGGDFDLSVSFGCVCVYIAAQRHYDHYDGHGGENSKRTHTQTHPHTLIRFLL